MLSIALDWLSVTFHSEVKAHDFLLRYATSAKDEPIAPIRGYEWGTRCASGVSRYTASSRPEMGIHVVFSGQALAHFNDIGIKSSDILTEALVQGGKVSRIDLSKDATGEGIDLDAIAKSAINGSYKGRARECKEWRDKEGGQTIYIGSRTSDRFARIYNKSAERKITGDWVRYEFELKGHVAKQIARVLDQNQGNWDGVFNEMASKFFMVNVGGYEKFLQNGSAIGLPKVHKQTDRESWIMKQVISAVCEHLDEYPDSPAVDALLWAIQGKKGGTNGKFQNGPGEASKSKSLY